MAFRRVRRRYMEARKINEVKPIVEELLQAIEGNGMTVRAWFEAMDQIAINNMVTPSELSQGMRMLLVHSVDRKKQPVLTAEKVGGFMRETSFSQPVSSRLSTISDERVHLLWYLCLVFI